MIYRDFSVHNPLVQVRLGVPSEVILGSPKKNCQGIGICRINRAGTRYKEAQSVQTKQTCQAAKALLVAQSTDTLYIYFIKHSIKAGPGSAQFNRRVFRITEPVSLPDDISVELGFQKRSIITRGAYPIVDLGTHLCLAVKIARNRLGTVSYH